MNRAARRAEMRAKRNKGSGFTSHPVQRSLHQIELAGIGRRRHQRVRMLIEYGMLPLTRRS